MKLSAALRRHATTIVLCALALGAGAAVFVLDRGAVTTDEAQQRKKNLLAAFRPDEITAVEIAAHGQKATLERKGPDALGQRSWAIVADGARFPVDEQNVDQYLGTLEFAVYQRIVDATAVDRKAMGLDAPRARIALSMGPQSARVLVGGAAPDGGVYAEVEGRGVYVITAELADQLDVDPGKLREKTLVPYGTHDLGRIEIGGEHGARTFVRAPAPGEIFRVGEGGSRVGRAALDDLQNALLNAKAEAFLPDDVADRESKPEVTLTLVPRDASRPRIAMTLGGACPNAPEQIIAIRREPSRLSACVPKEVLEPLVRPADAFVDRDLFAARHDEVTEIEIEQGGRKLSLARKGTGWHQRQPMEREVEAEAGRAMIEALLAVRASSFVTGKDPDAVGLIKAPRARVRVVSLLPSADTDGGDADRVEEIVIGEPLPEGVPALRTDDGAIAMIPVEAARALLPDETALRDRTVIDVPVERIRALRVEQGARVQKLERTPTGGYQLVEPKGTGLAADLGLASDLAEAIAALHAERYVAAHDDGSFGLAKPRLSIEADLGAGADAGAATIRILLGAPTAGGSFARKDGDDAVFVVDGRLEEAAGRWLLDRTVFTLAPDDITRVTLAAGGKGKKLVLERAGDALRIAGDAGQADASARAAAIRDALGDLVPEGAVSVGAPRGEEGLDPPAARITVERGDPQRTVRIRLGRGDAFRGTAVVYARREGVDATYVIAQARVRPLLDAVSP
jgi:hypothetical protein